MNEFDDYIEAAIERAAICQSGGGLSRAEACRVAMAGAREQAITNGKSEREWLHIAQVVRLALEVDG